MKIAASGVPITKCDPDLIEARRCVIDTLEVNSHRRCNCRAEIAAGKWDAGHKVTAAFEAVKRGRALERGNR